MLNTIFAAYYAMCFGSFAYLIVNDYYETHKPKIKKEIELSILSKKCNSNKTYYLEPLNSNIHPL